MQNERPVTKEEAMSEYTFRVDTPFGYEITTLTAESISAAKTEVMKRSRRDSVDVSLIAIRSLTPQIPLVGIGADFADFIAAAKKYTDLGWAVQDQLDELLNGNLDLNPNAVVMIADFAREISDDIESSQLHGAIAAYYEQRDS